MVGRVGVRGVLASVIVVLAVTWGLTAQENLSLQGSVGIIHALAFDGDGVPEIAGWRWLRPESRQYVDWVFGPIQTGAVAQSDPYFYIHIDSLVTNGLNGGSGWSTHVRVEVYLIRDLGTALGLPEPVGKDISTRTSVLLDNPFLPQVEGNTNGTGYQASAEPLRIATTLINRYADEYGAFLLVRVVRKGGTSGEPEHVAVQPSSVWLSFAVAP